MMVEDHYSDEVTPLSQRDLVECLMQPPRDLASATGVSACTVNRSSLVNPDEAWDAIQIESLVVRPDRWCVREDSFVLRPFWFSESPLQYTESSYTTVAHGEGGESKGFWVEKDISRSLLTCCAPMYTWRDNTCAYICQDGEWMRSGTEDVRVFLYNHIDQTLSVESSRSNEAGDGKPLASRAFAMWQLPIVVPLGPIRVGETWEVRDEGSCIQFCVERFQRIGDASLAFIRRNGLLAPPCQNQGIASNGTSLPVREVLGLTVWALGCGIVLEDRRILRPMGNNQGSTVRTALRLLESR
jgi:hypothetical protein